VDLVTHFSRYLTETTDGETRDGSGISGRQTRSHDKKKKKRHLSGG